MAVPESELEIVALRQFDDLNRVLAPNEMQELLVARMPGDEATYRDQFETMKKHRQTVVHFRAADGKEISTANQFAALGETTN